MENKAFSDLMEALNTHDRVVSCYQTTPRTYGTEDLLYQTDVHIIQKIAENPGMSLNELAEKTYRTKSAMSAVIKPLVKRKLIGIKRDNEDKRRYVITLTEKGELVNKFHEEFDKFNYEEILEQMNEISNIGNEEILTTLKIIEIINRVLHKRLEHLD